VTGAGRAFTNEQLAEMVRRRVWGLELAKSPALATPEYREAFFLHPEGGGTAERRQCIRRRQ
jgi:hypothetical protein